MIAERTLSRPLSDSEQQVVLADQQEFLTYYQTHLDDAKSLIATGESPVDPNLDPAMLAAWTLVCNQILNLDETLNK